MKYSRVTVRYASGYVEHRYEATLPKVGDRLGRNGDEGFVTGVEADEQGGEATVSVGTPAPKNVSWNDLSAPDTTDGETANARERILDAAYELFSRRGIRAVGTEEVLAKAGVAKSTLYRHFPSKDELVLAFLQRREQRWTREFVLAEARRRGSTPRDRLLAIFDVFDDWFHRDDFEGCSFINVLLEMGDLDSPLGQASAAHLEYIRSAVRRLAEEAGVQDSETFAHSWHILMKGSIVAAGEGDELAGKRARAMGEDLLDRYLRVTGDPWPHVPSSSRPATAAEASAI
jgi:AcrR family transcriptional regulator